MIYIYSGLPPGMTGTGQLIQFISEEYSKNEVNLHTPGISFDHYRIIPTFIKVRLNRLLEQRLFSKYLRKLKSSPPTQLILFHPQSIGFKETLELMHVALAAKFQVKLYLLDNSFFCVKSYNCLDGQECNLCIEKGSDMAVQSGCTPFPNKSKEAFGFRKDLLEFVRKGHVEVYFQCVSQKQLAESWFERKFKNESVVGMWTKDLETAFEEKILPSHLNSSPFDIVFHGINLEAKGAIWAIRLAEKLTHLKFFFPFEKPAFLESKALSNCHFESMTWTTGLKDQISRSRAVIVPSLWSAPIEGALIKSIIYSGLVFAVENDHGYASSINAPNLVLLPYDIGDATRKCGQLMNNKSVINRDEVSDWLNSFKEFNRAFMKRLTQN